MGSAVCPCTSDGSSAALLNRAFRAFTAATITIEGHPPAAVRHPIRYGSGVQRSFMSRVMRVFSFLLLGAAVTSAQQAQTPPSDTKPQAEAQGSTRKPDKAAAYYH